MVLTLPRTLYRFSLAWITTPLWIAKKRCERDVIGITVGFWRAWTHYTASSYMYDVGCKKFSREHEEGPRGSHVKVIELLRGSLWTSRQLSYLLTSSSKPSTICVSSIFGSSTCLISSKSWDNDWESDSMSAIATSTRANGDGQTRSWGGVTRKVFGCLRGFDWWMAKPQLAIGRWGSKVCMITKTAAKAVGKIPFRSDELTMAVITGSNSSSQAFKVRVGRGSVGHDLEGES